MHPFTLERPGDLAAALALGAAGPGTEYIAGGTDMLPLMKDDLRRPDRLVALGPRVLDDRIEVRAHGGLHLGAAARMSDVADHPDVQRAFPLIAEALLASASPQIRNMATLGGNLLQRTRCSYYRDAGVETCNKRRPGSGCAAMEGDNRLHAVLGGSEHCIATHASDLAVALVALDASVVLRGAGGERRVAVEGFYRMPGDAPDLETMLETGELITAIEVPGGEALARHAHYLKVRDRASFEFALVSAAVAIAIDGDRIGEARVAMGGVATVPWRLRDVEEALAGAPAEPAAYRAAVARATAGAVPRSGNAFKLDLIPRVLVRALEIAWRGAAEGEPSEPVWRGAAEGEPSEPVWRGAAEGEPSEHEVAGAAPMSSPASSIGQPVPRVDGPLKVTGQARYAADFDVGPTLAHAVVVQSTIARGRVTVDAAEAERAPGVLAVLSHENAPRLAYRAHRADVDPGTGERIHVLQDDRVVHQGQHIAVVVAETLEQAAAAAALVRVRYAVEPAVTDFADAMSRAVPPDAGDDEDEAPGEDGRGDFDKTFDAAPVKVEVAYVIPRETHHPIEPHATIAAWSGRTLTLWDKTQWVDNVRDEIAAVFGMPAARVRVVSPFVGGAFGSALRAWPHVTLAAMAARHVGRPVKLVLTRRQMQGGTGYRPRTTQRVALGADRSGHLLAIRHDGVAETSTYEEHTESLLEATRLLYSCPNVKTRYRLAPMHVNTPTYMRAPGEASGVFALECAMDELAVILGMDPVELRRQNDAERDEDSDRPFSSRALRECFRVGAERFGWARRVPRPRSMRDAEDRLVGYGCAAATYPAYIDEASARVVLHPDGSAIVSSAASDMGPGTYTSMTQVAADTLGLPLERVRFELGDTRLPSAPAHGGSVTMASVGAAVQAACAKARRQALAGTPRSSRARADLATIMRQRGRPIAVTVTSKPGPATDRYSMHAFGAVFAHVTVDPDLGTVRVPRLVGVYGAGRLVNPRLARSQAIGGMVMGMGMALMEQTSVDARTGRVVTADLAEYLVPVNPDVGELDVTFLPEHDPHVNPLGVKGLAEISVVGVAAAIANGVHHATGRRLRELPLVAEKLL